LVSCPGSIVGVWRETGYPPTSVGLVRSVKPNEPSIVGVFPRRSWGAHEFHELLRQQALSVPDSSLEVQEADTCPVPSGSEVVTSKKEVTVGISLQGETANPDLIEEGALRPGQVLFT